MLNVLRSLLFLPLHCDYIICLKCRSVSTEYVCVPFRCFLFLRGLGDSLLPTFKIKSLSTGNAGDLGSIPGSGRSSGEGNGNPLQYSCLENFMDRGAWQATVHGFTRVRYDWVTKPPPSVYGGTEVVFECIEEKHKKGNKSLMIPWLLVFWCISCQLLMRNVIFVLY